MAVDFPFELDLSVHLHCVSSDNIEGHVDGNTVPKRAMYELVGVIHHIGNSLAAGHYVAHSRRGGKWIRFNDDVMTCVAQDEVRSTYVDEIYGTATPYLLFYQRYENTNEWQAPGPAESVIGPLKTQPCDATSTVANSVAAAVSSSPTSPAPEHSAKLQPTPPALGGKHECARQQDQTAPGSDEARLFPDVFSVTLFDCEEKGSAVARQVTAQTSIDLQRLVLARVSRTGHVDQIVFFAPVALDEEFQLRHGDRIAAFEVPESFSPTKHFLLEVHFPFSILPQSGGRSVGELNLHDKAGALSASANTATSEPSGTSILLPIDRKAQVSELSERATSLFDQLMSVEPIPVPIKAASTPANSPNSSDSQTHMKRRTPLSDVSKAARTCSSATPTTKRPKMSESDSSADSAKHQKSTPASGSSSPNFVDIAAGIEGDSEACSGTEAMLEEASRIGADGIDSDDDVGSISSAADDTGFLVVDIVPKQAVSTPLVPHAPLQCIIPNPFDVPDNSVLFFRVRAPPGHDKSCFLRARIPIPPKWLATMVSNLHGQRKPFSLNVMFFFLISLLLKIAFHCMHCNVQKESVLAIGGDGFMDAFVMSKLKSFEPVLRQRPWSSMEPDGGAWRCDRSVV